MAHKLYIMYIIVDHTYQLQLLHYLVHAHMYC